MDMIYTDIVAFLIVLAVFDLVVGVSNDAVNFLNSAIGAKVAKYRTIVCIAAIGVFAGAAMSNGMMDVARHGIMTPEYFSFYDVMCVFLAVMVTDIVLLDVFNTLGMPTSTTVSMVFELLGGAFAIAILKILGGTTGADGTLLTLGDLLNTDKAITCILGIFFSVGIAFIVGTVVMWIARLLFTFTYNRFFKWLGSGIVLFGTFLLAFSFASNDLVNFVGVPLSGLEAYQDYVANGNGNPDGFMMTSLKESAHTPVAYLVLAGVVMVLALVFSPKTQNVSKTEVGLGRQDAGDEMFGSSAVARSIVRNVRKVNKAVSAITPAPVSRWIDTRFNNEDAVLPQGAAFDQIRASVNLLLAGLLVAFGTSMKLPLSTTYVTFMVAMGTSLADRAWGRESAVYRITGVLSVIGGWFITAGAAFILCYCITNAIYFGSFVAMGIAIVGCLWMVIRSNIKFQKKQKEEKGDVLFNEILRTHDKGETWRLVQQHVCEYNEKDLRFIIDAYSRLTDAFFEEDYRTVKHITEAVHTQRRYLKRIRRREIIGLRRCDPMVAIEKNTWFFLANNSMQQMYYSMIRLSDPCYEHLSNNFSPVGGEYTKMFLSLRNQVVIIMQRTEQMLQTGDFSDGEKIRQYATTIQQSISAYRKSIFDDIQQKPLNLEAMTVFLNIIQESQEQLSAIRHLIRGMMKLKE